MVPLPLQLPSLLPNSVCPPFAYCRVDVPPAVGGLCILGIWVAVAPDERVERRDYADARTYIIRLRGGRDLTVFYGASAPKLESGLPTLLIKDDEPISRIASGAGGGSYRAGAIYFSGSVFEWSAADAAVFGRVHFGAAGRRLCQHAPE